MDYALIIFTVLFISMFVMIHYLVTKKLLPANFYRAFNAFNENSLTFPFLFRDYVKKNNKYLIIVYYIFILSGFLLYFVFMVELFTEISKDAPVIIKYIVLGSVFFISSIIALMLYMMSNEKYY